MEAKKASPAPGGGKAHLVHVDAFNRTLKLLVTDLKARFPEDAIVGRAHKRTMAVIEISPLFAMEAVGQYMYTYREQIYALEGGTAESEAFFLENSYDKEIKAGVKAEKVELVNYIMPKVKDLIRGLAADKKAAYKTKVVELLDSYVEYLAAVRIGAPKKG